MHVLFRESHGLEETATPQDLGQAPADLVVLSFSDSDLGAFAEGFHRARRMGNIAHPTLRLANLSALTHPLSVDTYIERTLSGAKGILIRLIGGASWWAYGVEQVSRLAQERGIALAILPADGRPDPALDAASTLPVSTLRRLQGLCEAGGEIAAQGALAQLALAAGLYAGPVPGAKTLPAFGLWHPETGYLPAPPAGEAPLIAIPFYRAWAAAADTAGIAALIRGFEAAGFRALGLFIPSLKEPAAVPGGGREHHRLLGPGRGRLSAGCGRRSGVPGDPRHLHPLCLGSIGARPFPRRSCHARRFARGRRTYRRRGDLVQGHRAA